jgi:hypothetical protein
MPPETPRARVNRRLPGVRALQDPTRWTMCPASIWLNLARAPSRPTPVRSLSRFCVYGHQQLAIWTNGPASPFLDWRDLQHTRLRNLVCSCLGSTPTAWPPVSNAYLHGRSWLAQTMTGCASAKDRTGHGSRTYSAEEFVGGLLLCPRPLVVPGASTPAAAGAGDLDQLAHRGPLGLTRRDSLPSSLLGRAHAYQCLGHR